MTAPFPTCKFTQLELSSRKCREIYSFGYARLLSANTHMIISRAAKGQRARRRKHTKESSIRCFRLSYINWHSRLVWLRPWPRCGICGLVLETDAIHQFGKPG